MSATIEVLEQLVNGLYDSCGKTTIEIELLERTIAELKGGRPTRPASKGKVVSYGKTVKIRYHLLDVEVPIKLNYQERDWYLDAVMRDQGVKIDGGYYFYFWNSGTHQIRVKRDDPTESLSESDPIIDGAFLYYKGCRYGANS